MLDNYARELAKASLKQGKNLDKKKQDLLGGTATGNPVAMDGLQGGVPFNNITVSGNSETSIVGREMTLNVAGKNLLPITMADTATSAGVTALKSADNRITVSGTTTGSSFVFISSSLNYVCQNDTIISYIGTLVNDNVMVSYKPNGATSNIYYNINFNSTLQLHTGDIVASVYLQQSNTGREVSGYAYIQMELGNIATDYEQYNGTTYTITPDSNPYIVTADVRQVDGLNNVWIADDSNPVLEINYNRTNPMLKKLQDEIDELKTAIVATAAESGV